MWGCKSAFQELWISVLMVCIQGYYIMLRLINYCFCLGTMPYHTSKGRDQGLPSCLFSFFISYFNVMCLSAAVTFPSGFSIIEIWLMLRLRFGVQFMHSLDFPTRWYKCRWRCDGLPGNNNKNKKQNSHFRHVRSWPQNWSTSPHLHQKWAFQFTKSPFFVYSKIFRNPGEPLE